MNFDVALFLPESSSNGVPLFDCVDALIQPFANDKRVIRWHPYKVHEPYTCVEHPPMAFIGSDGHWHECDVALEKSASRLVKKRQKTFAAIQDEEIRVYDQETAMARCLVRFALWESDHPFPLTPWRHVWRQALLEHASMVVVYLACEHA